MQQNQLALNLSATKRVRASSVPQTDTTDTTTELTHWFNVHSNPPPCTGFWLLSAGTVAPVQTMAWYKRLDNVWSVPGKSMAGGSLPPAAQWCGLTEPPADGYTYFVHNAKNSEALLNLNAGAFNRADMVPQRPIAPTAPIKMQREASTSKRRRDVCEASLAGAVDITPALSPASPVRTRIRALLNG